MALDHPCKMASTLHMVLHGCKIIEPIINAWESFLKSFTCAHIRQFKDFSSFCFENLKKKYNNSPKNINFYLKNYGFNSFATK